MERASDFIFLGWSTPHIVNTILGHAHFWIFWRESFVYGRVSRQQRMYSFGCRSQPSDFWLTQALRIYLPNAVNAWQWRSAALYSLPKVQLRKGTFFLGGGGEGWGVLVFFSKKSVGPAFHFNKKNSWPPTFRWLTKVRPSPHSYMVCFKVNGVQKNVLPREWRRAMWILLNNRLFESFFSYINSTTLSRLQQTLNTNFHYLPSTKTPTSGRKPDDYQPRAQTKQMFQEGKLKAGDKKAVKEFLLKNTLFRKSLLQIMLSIWHWNETR